MLPPKLKIPGAPKPAPSLNLPKPQTTLAPAPSEPQPAAPVPATPAPVRSPTPGAPAAVASIKRPMLPKRESKPEPESMSVEDLPSGMKIMKVELSPNHNVKVNVEGGGSMDRPREPLREFDVEASEEAAKQLQGQIIDIVPGYKMVRQFHAKVATFKPLAYRCVAQGDGLAVWKWIEVDLYFNSIHSMLVWVYNENLLPNRRLEVKTYMTELNKMMKEFKLHL